MNMKQVAAGPEGKRGLERRERAWRKREQQSPGTQEEDKAVLENRVVD